MVIGLNILVKGLCRRNPAYDKSIDAVEESQLQEIVANEFHGRFHHQVILRDFLSFFDQCFSA